MRKKVSIITALMMSAVLLLGSTAVNSSAYENYEGPEDATRTVACDEELPGNTGNVGSPEGLADDLGLLIDNADTDNADTDNADTDNAISINEHDGSDALNVSSLYPYSTVKTGNPSNGMAHYMCFDPDLSGTSGRFTGYSIDFKADYDPKYTYWSLCNWCMEGGAWAYAGLQNNVNGRQAIISFWENNGVNAQRVYPDSYTNAFGGEGEGTNSLVDYPWKAGQWYRMVLYCYDDSASKHTYVAQWIQDKQTGAWTLLTVFDTKLTNSCMTSSLGAFLEDYSPETCEEIRTIQLKNIYVLEKGSSTWKGINKVSVNLQFTDENKKGGYARGAATDYFWGITCGAGANVISNPTGYKDLGTLRITNTDTAPNRSFIPTSAEMNMVKEGLYTIGARINTSYKLSLYNNSLVVKTKGTQFEIKSCGDGTYRIIDKSSGLALQADTSYTKQAGTGDFLKIKPQAVANTDYQKWYISRKQSGDYSIINKKWNLYLDLQDAYAGENNAVNLFSKNDYYKAQDWQLVLIKDYTSPSPSPSVAPSKSPTPSPSVTPSPSATPSKAPTSGDDISNQPTPSKAPVNNGDIDFVSRYTNLNEVQSFVNRLYFILLGREAEWDGLNSWANKLSDGSANASQIVEGIVNSDEFNNLNLPNSEVVERMYKAMLGRTSDDDGRNYWVNKLNNGSSVNLIINGFAGSTEFGSICNRYSIKAGSISLGEPRDQNEGVAAFVARCYQKALGRTYEKKGINDWCSRILGAADKRRQAEAVASDGFFHSQEFANKHTSNDEYVEILYRTFLGREYDAAGKADWVGKLNAGVSRDDVLYGFSRSAEFGNIMAGYGL